MRWFTKFALSVSRIRYYGSKYVCIVCNSQIIRFLDNSCPVCGSTDVERSSLFAFNEYYSYKRAVYINKDHYKNIFGNDEFNSLDEEVVTHYLGGESLKKYDLICADFLPERIINLNSIEKFLKGNLSLNGVFITLLRSQFDIERTMDLSKTHHFSYKSNQAYFGDFLTIRRLGKDYLKYLSTKEVYLNICEEYKMMPDFIYQKYGLCKDFTPVIFSIIQNVDYEFVPEKMIKESEEKAKDNYNNLVNNRLIRLFILIIFWGSDFSRNMVKSTSDNGYDTDSWRYIGYSSLISLIMLILSLLLIYEVPFFGLAPGFILLIGSFATIVKNQFMLSYSSYLKKIAVFLISAFFIIIITGIGIGGWLQLRGVLYTIATM
ncbi:MAG: hypothetical protein JXR48_16605 [Candidatus Delongbacteria bacterium]|nr:hypothetical protein [Candidatus Delongbacteria bacterium]